jgi:DNA polymerase-3 subunit gamma/tau
MELYKKYRPQSLKEIHGNKETVNSLTTLFEKNELPHSILLTGPKGCGKTTLGRIIKNELGCRDFDYKELDTAVFRGIDTVRDIRQQMMFSPVQSPCRVWLLDEVHSLGRGADSAKNEAQNAFLKSLEDTPEHVYFILCTTNPEMLISTIKSRCVEFKVQALSDMEMTGLIKKVLKKEKEQIPSSVTKSIVKYAEGSPRNALQLLEKVFHLNDEKEMLYLVKSESQDQAGAVNALCQALLKGEKWDKVKGILSALKNDDPESIRRGIIGYAGAVLLNGNESASLILGWFLYKNTYDSGFPLITQFCYNIVTGIEPPC